MILVVKNTRRKKDLNCLHKHKKGALDRFVVKEGQVGTENQTACNVEAAGTGGSSGNSGHAHALEIDPVVNPTDAKLHTSDTNEIQEDANGVDGTLNGSASSERNNDFGVLFSLIYLSQDIRIHLIKQCLIFCFKRVLKETYLFKKDLKIDLIEGSPLHITLEF